MHEGDEDHNGDQENDDAYKEGMGSQIGGYFDSLQFDIDGVILKTQFLHAVPNFGSMATGSPLFRQVGDFGCYS